MKRLVSIDAIRGAAALSVLLTHWAAWTGKYANAFTTRFIDIVTTPINFLWPNGGGVHIGVIIFIVLSGFCIHLPQARNINQLAERGFWSKYIRRRAFRILPVYLFALTLGLVTAVLISTPDLSSFKMTVFTAYLTAVLGVSEIVRFIPSDLNNYLYFGNKPLSTVAVEMLLYASYPLFLFIHRKFSLVGLMIFAIASYSSIIVLRAAGIEPPFLSGTYFEFMLYWVWGAVCAEIYMRHINEKKGFITIIIMAGGFIFLYIFLAHLVSLKGFHVVTTALFAFASGLFIIGLLGLENSNYALIKKALKPLGSVGEQSYSLYALHTPVILGGIALLSYFDIPPNFYPWTTLILVMASTVLCFKLIENPMHLKAQKLTRPLPSK